jgi:NAD(P)H dehydrogenase (quinone)
VIAVTGATGEVGGRVAGHLAERGLEQLLVVRDRSRAPEFERAEVRQAPRGYGDLEDMKRALDGAETLFLVPAAEAADRIDQHRTAVDAAVAAGVGRIVYLSFVNASPDATFTLVRHHWATEEHVRATGLPCTFPRMSLYMDFIPTMAGDDGVIRGPAGDGRLAPILREDVAAACAAILASDDHDGKTYDLTGTQAFTLAEIAEAIGARFENETIEEAYASRAHLGAPDWEVEGWVTSYAAVAAGELDVVSDDVRRLTGEEPATLEQYLRRL